MLVDLTPNQEEIDRRKRVAKEHDFEFIPQSDPQWKQGTGIYQCNFGFNFSHDEFMEFKDYANVPFAQSYEVFKPDYRKSQYGVADSIDQIKEYFKEEIDDPERKYVISVTPVWQKDQPEWGGWRWHKWGEYIGELNPQCEYLYDEKFGEDFEYVICYHLYEVI